MDIDVVPIQEFDCLDSTNAHCQQLVANEELRSPSDDIPFTPFAVLAKTQTAGRGRSGNAWVSQPGNLNFSLACVPARPMEQWASLSLVVGLCLVDLFQTRAGVGVQAKWPNDLMFEGKKLGGILLEVAYDPSGNAHLVVGVGLNLATAPQLTDKSTISLSQILGPGHGKPVPRHLDTIAPKSWAEDIAAAFMAQLSVWDRKGFAPFVDRWKRVAMGMDAPLCVRLPNRRFKATMRGLDDDGALVVDLADGTRHRVTSGDVFFGEEA